MIKNYQEAVSFLNSRIRFGMKAGLANIKLLTKVLDSPQENFKSVHVAGTNGKGSTALYFASMLTQANQKVALFSSPHLLSFRERIRILEISENNSILFKTISEKEVIDFLNKIELAANKINISPTFFETLTVLALLFFKKEKVDLAVLEVGLGGRLDATNEVDGVLSIIPSISLEHVEILGNTTEKILYEKMGVARKNKSLWVGDLGEHLVEVAKKYSGEIGCDLKKFSGNLLNLNLKNNADYYYHNASLAYEAAMDYLEQYLPKLISTDLELQILQKKFMLSLEDVLWPGRMQILEREKNKWILDGAHNEAAISGLVESLAKLYPNQKFKLLLGVSADKDIVAMLNKLLPYVSEVHIPYAKSERLAKPNSLKKIIKELSANSHGKNSLKSEIGYVHCEIYESVALACDVLENSDDIVLACGSLYFIGEIILELRDKCSELAWFREFDKEKNEFG